jgi:hypothetical protein
MKHKFMNTYLINGKLRIYITIHLSFFKAIYSEAIQVINGRTDREGKRKFRPYSIDEINTIPHVNDKL